MDNDSKPIDDPYTEARQRMVECQIRRRGIQDERVLAAMRDVPRHAFLPSCLHKTAYDDGPLPIGWDQTISQPYTVAFMCEAIQLTGIERVLEIGAGSGYGAAVLSRLACCVYSIERIPELAARAEAVLTELGYSNVQIIAGDGTLGYPDHAPYDAIIATAGAATLPEPYLEQLAPGGRIVIPIGDRPRSQTMRRYTRKNGQLQVENLGGFAFVPLIGQYGWGEGT
ncbi:MAG: protein-L-isoaspartate(D-aspartate) O-methyltransferase [Pirellulales bacterium]|nr:protein-L-isoaspartate(D-aspartate) O-methyltransferase [Pirellulales bacterium]